MIGLLVLGIYVIGLFIALVVVGKSQYDINKAEIRWRYDEGDKKIAWAFFWPIAVVFFGPKFLIEKTTHRIMAPQRAMKALAK